MLNQVSFLLAAIAPWESIGSYLRRAGSASENIMFLLFATIIVSIWIALYVWERYRRNRPESASSKLSLFDELCAAHGLRPADIICLQEAAEFHQLAQPALLFVEPERLKSFSNHRPQDATRFDQLHDRLFGAIPVR